MSEQRWSDNRVNVVNPDLINTSQHRVPLRPLSYNNLPPLLPKTPTRPPLINSVLSNEQIEYIEKKLISSESFIRFIDSHLKSKVATFNGNSNGSNNAPPPDYIDELTNASSISLNSKLENQEFSCRCDGCKNPAFGTWYHCDSCPNYDLCKKCFNNVDGQPHTHRILHGFLRVRSREDIIMPEIMHMDYYPAETWERLYGFKQSEHTGIICNGCGQKPIKGERYKCAVCSDFDFCAKCEASPTINNHEPYHPMIKYKFPINYNKGRQ